MFIDVEEKLRAMERIWENLCRDEAAIPSPAWHEEVLNAREARLQSSQETCTDLDTAKKRIDSAYAPEDSVYDRQ